MINILYDLTATQPSHECKFHGGGTYTEIIFLKILSIFDKNDISLFVAYDSSRYINPLLLEESRKKNVKIIDIIKESPKEIFSKYKIDRFYSGLLYQSLGWDLTYSQVITTIHGLRSFELPFDPIILKYDITVKEKIKDWKKLIKFYFDKDQYVKKLCTDSNLNRIFKSSVRIITDSQHSKASILSFFPQVNSNDIKVFSAPSFDQLEHNPIIPVNFEILKEKDNIESKKYMLITSAARWIKNAMRAVFAFDSLFDDGKINDMKVVLTGVNNKDIFEKQIRHKEKFILLEYVEREELESLHKNSYAFIYPSLNEGFGYPPVEAMKYGVPVAASGTSSIPEICGDAVLYFDPYNVSEIKNRILQLTDESIYNRLSKESSLKYKEVSEMQKNDLEKLVNFILTGQ